MINGKAILLAVGLFGIVAAGSYVWWLQRNNELLTKQLATANQQIALFEVGRVRAAKAQAKVIKQDSAIHHQRAKVKSRLSKVADDELPGVIRDALEEVSEGE